MKNFLLLFSLLFFLSCSSKAVDDATTSQVNEETSVVEPALPVKEEVPETIPPKEEAPTAPVETPEVKEETPSAPVEEPQKVEEPVAENISQIYIRVNGAVLTVDLAETESAKALAQLLKNGDVTIHGREYGGFEKVGPLGTSIARNDTQIKGKPGDLILYQGNQVTLFYGENSYSYSRLGFVKDATREGLLSILGTGDVDFVLTLNK